AGQAVNCLVFGIVVAALASLSLKFIARESSASRFAVLYSSLLAILALLFWRSATGGEDALPAHAAVNVSGTWATYLLAGWAAIALCGLMRITAGLVRLQRLRRSFVLLNRDFGELVLSASRPVRIYVSQKVRVPTAIGFFRPAVVLPEW